MADSIREEHPVFLISRYNFHIPLISGSLLFNAASGQVLRLDGPDSSAVAATLCGSPGLLPGGDIDVDTLSQLRRGGFLLERDTNEVDAIRQNYLRARRDTPIVLTITATMDCNLGCYYCYESRADYSLKSTDAELIVKIASQRLEQSGKKSLHIDWYGGEPLLNIDFIEEASLALQEMCKAKGVRYNASVISNGTCWPEDVVGFVNRHKIGQVQISFDGMEKHHNKRRRYRRSYKNKFSKTSFELATALVDRLINCARVDLRYNIDYANASDLSAFIKYARQRGWFDGPFPLSFQPARLASYTEKSGFMADHQLSPEKFDSLRRKIRSEVNGDTTVEESEAPDGFPYPKASVCAALANDSLVIGANGATYRCGLQVGENNSAVGTIYDNMLAGIPVQTDQDYINNNQWWSQFDPTERPNCQRCSFLPVCWGGCPKKHLEEDIRALDEQGLYWRENLARLVSSKIGVEALSHKYAESDQFRNYSFSEK